MAFNDGEQDPMEREALLAQLAPPKNTGMTGIGLPGGVATPAVSGSAQEVAGGGLPKGYDAYAAPAAGDLSANAGENHATLMGMGKGAASGALSGAMAGGAGAVPMAAYGAISGLVKGRHNDTKNEREQFAQSQGVADSTGLWDKLNTSVPTGVAQELQGRALNRIGKHDETANTQWMSDVQAALAAGKPPPPTPAAPTATDPPATSSASTAAPTGMGQYAGNMTGFDANKFADPNRSEKYKIGEVMSRFDPKLGVTPEMLAALNALGIAQFSGSGDQLTLTNTKNDPRMGRGGTSDVIKGLKGQNGDTAWAPWFVDDGAGDAAAQGPAAGAGGGGGLPGSLVSTDPEFFKKLMAQLQGSLSGPTSVDDSALRQLL